MGSRLERRLSRFFPDAGAKIADGDRWGHVELENGKVVLRRDMIERELSDAVIFVQQAMNFAGVEELWQMNCYDFYRLLVKAKQLQTERLKALENQKGNAKR